MINTTKKSLILKLFLRFNNLSLLLLWSSFISTAQISVPDSTAICDSCFTETEFSFFMLDFNYTSNTIKAKGTRPDESVPAFISSANYLHKTGLTTDIMFTNYSAADSFSYDLEFQIGYEKSLFNEHIDLGLNYQYHNYSGTTEYQGIDYHHAIHLSTGLNYEMLYVYADGIYYMDNKNYFNDFGLTLSLDFENILFKNDFLFLMPTTSFTFATDYWLYELYTPYIENYIIPYLRYRGYATLNLTSEQIMESYMLNNGVSTNTYSYQGVDFLIPLTYGINNISVSFSWMYYIPSEKLKLFQMKEQTGYIISLSFIF